MTQTPDTGSVLDILIYVFDRYMLADDPEVPEREALAQDLEQRVMGGECHRAILAVDAQSQGGGLVRSAHHALSRSPSRKRSANRSPTAAAHGN